MGEMRVRQRVGSETYNIESAHERDEILSPPPPRSSPKTVILPSTGPKATVSRGFVLFADVVGAKPPSKPAPSGRPEPLTSYISISTTVRAIIFTYQAEVSLRAPSAVPSFVTNADCAEPLLGDDR